MTKRVNGGRLSVQLEYPGGKQEHFEWQLFSPQQMEGFAKDAGLHLLIACSGFNATSFPAALDPRLQFVLER